MQSHLEPQTSKTEQRTTNQENTEQEDEGRIGGEGYIKPWTPIWMARHIQESPPEQAIGLLRIWTHPT